MSAARASATAYCETSLTFKGGGKSSTLCFALGVLYRSNKLYYWYSMFMFRVVLMYSVS